MADPKAPERWWFCPDCGLRDTHKHDVGAHDNCSECGMDCWPESTLKEMLAKAGRHIVSEADRKVLEAMAALPDPLLTGMATWPHFSEPIKAELEARKTRTP